MSALPSDIIKLLTTYLMPHDIINLGKSCRELHSILLCEPSSSIIWRNYVAKVVAINTPLVGISTESMNWQQLAFEKNRLLVNNLLQKQHLLYRLVFPF